MLLCQLRIFAGFFQGSVGVDAVCVRGAACEPGTGLGRFGQINAAIGNPASPSGIGKSVGESAEFRAGSPQRYSFNAGGLQIQKGGIVPSEGVYALGRKTRGAAWILPHLRKCGGPSQQHPGIKASLEVPC